MCGFISTDSRFLAQLVGHAEARFAADAGAWHAFMLLANPCVLAPLLKYKESVEGCHADIAGAYSPFHAPVAAAANLMLGTCAPAAASYSAASFAVALLLRTSRIVLIASSEIGGCLQQTTNGSVDRSTVGQAQQIIYQTAAGSVDRQSATD